MQVTFVENHYDPDPTDTTSELALILLVRKGHELSIETDRHICEVFPKQIWRRLLRQAGFTIQDKAVEAISAQLGNCPALLATKQD